MGTLAIDIETASPDEEPPKDEFENTDYFELVAVALGFRPSDESTIESQVLFREGDWTGEYTAELLERVAEWVAGYRIDTVLTYNGTGFDFIHLRNWATQTDDAQLTDCLANQMKTLESKQIDLKYPATEHHSDLMKPTHSFPKFEMVCKARSVPVTETEYANYNLNSDFLQNIGLTAETVEGWHIGKYLGEQYVEGITNGLQETLTYRELKQMLSDYAKADVRPLFDLYDSFDDSDLEYVPNRNQQ